jgi:hypothetical protein
VTFEDDFVRLHMSVGSPNIPLVKLGLEWPPPEYLLVELDGIRAAIPEDLDGVERPFVMVRERFSVITDDQRAGMTHVCRGAEYRYVEGAA